MIWKTAERPSPHTGVAFTPPAFEAAAFGHVAQPANRVFCGDEKAHCSPLVVLRDPLGNGEEVGFDARMTPHLPCHGCCPCISSRYAWNFARIRAKSSR